MYTGTHTHTQTQAHKHAPTHLHAHTHINSDTNTCMHTHTHTHTNSDIHVHAHTHTHTHTHTHRAGVLGPAHLALLQPVSLAEVSGCDWVMMEHSLKLSIQPSLAAQSQTITTYQLSVYAVWEKRKTHTHTHTHTYARKYMHTYMYRTMDIILQCLPLSLTSCYQGANSLQFYVKTDNPTDNKIY